ncbi:hypothetical protein PMZ80_001564 [Knufia obscura]|uniref:MARVEL domain-containing protein n=2 Tax=Knufia TaxID=430999 RepID=A0AAN8IQ29_9EURO|nr:hypothetical protein PMZ80_001564 [Knufia obscura]KAK5955612.1 hypothetical protein OHC33_003253 [Knufia fluminis]
MAFSLHGQRDKKIEDFSAKYFYSLTLSAFSVVIAFMLLFPHSHTFKHYPLDFILAVAWWIAFAFLLIEFSSTKCSTKLSDFATVALGGDCNTRRAAYGFAFLSGCFWLASTIIGCWVVSREKKFKRRTVHTISTPG